jgi:short-subunit dehydrogenase
MRRYLRALFAGRPWWMNALMVFCGYMAFVYVPWDFLAKPMAVDEEVWFGLRLHGFWAKATEPLHGAIYALGWYGFRRMKGWMWPWAAVYASQVALGSLIWSFVYVGGFGGVVLGIAGFVPLAALTVALWQADALFGAVRPPLRERYGEWGLVTGASAGIGAEFARALAREGLSVVLTARRAERLQALASELEKTYHVATRVVAADLADPAGPDRVADAVEGLEIAVLVNNAGFGAAGRFEKLDRARLREMVQLNCLAPVLLTHRLLPGMRARGRGAIIVVGSVAGRQALPLHGVYSATKAFDLLFGESLAVELEDHGIDVLVLEPGSTETEFQEVARETPHPGQSAAEVVAVALDALGRQHSVISGWLNWLRANAAQRLAPRRLVTSAAEELIAAQTPEELR